METGVPALRVVSTDSTMKLATSPLKSGENPDSTQPSLTPRRGEGEKTLFLGGPGNPGLPHGLH